VRGQISVVMKLPFLRRPEHEEPLVVSMTGVRLGDRVVYVGSTRGFFEPVAARVGLSGQTTVVAADPDTVKAAAERDGVLVDAVGTIPTDGSYDVAVLEARGAWQEAVSQLRSAVRRGGRLIVIAGQARGFRGWLGAFRPQEEPSPPDTEIVHVAEATGWGTARAIGGRDELRFVETFQR
jgi:hypothetical protein